MALEGFPCDFVVTPDIGHWYPDDLDNRIDQAVRYIFEK
jgi:hypothetical protein